MTFTTTTKGMVINGPTGITTAQSQKLAGIAAGAEVNQNAFSNVKVGDNTIAADGKTDTLTLAAGSNVTLTADTTNDKVTIAATNTTYSEATTSVAGLMSSSDKTKLDALDPSILMGYCETEAATTAKVATVKDANGNTKNLTLTAGLAVAITFKYGSTVEGPSLNVNGTGAKEVKFPNTSGGTAVGSVGNGWGNYETVLFTYDGTRWIKGPSSYSISALNAQKANLASPIFTGTPKAPTAAAGTNTTQIATTAFVTTAVAGGLDKIIYEDNVTLADILEDIYANKADLRSPTFAGTPTAPTASAGTDNTQIATTAFVTTAVNNAIGNITGLNFEIVPTLPDTGTAGTIYLISNGGSGQNIYDEYVWVNSKFEKIGTTDIDLSGYLQTTDIVAITNAEIDTILAT
jgi:hypothetical protein